MIHLPTTIKFEGSGAVLEDAEGGEYHFRDRNAALQIQALLMELHGYRTGEIACKEPHCSDGYCHLRDACPPPEPY